MKTAIVIPARYSSSRLPGKPLLRQTGKYLVQHVYERACQAKCANSVLVATDDPRIVAAVEKFGGRVLLTRRDHPSGTDRVAEVAQSLDADLIINLQGDEPLVEPSSLDLLADLLTNNGDADMATLAVPLRSPEKWHNPNIVKVVCDTNGRALYFSRSAIPYVRDGKPDFAANPTARCNISACMPTGRNFLTQLGDAAPCPSGKTGKTGTITRPRPWHRHPGRGHRTGWNRCGYLRRLREIRHDVPRKAAGSRRITACP